ncbi:MAG: hypothetical protein ACRCUZ_11820 [Shewanella sp.]
MLLKRTAFDKKLAAVKTFALLTNSHLDICQSIAAKLMLKTHKMLTSGLFENVMLRSVTNTMQSFAFTIGFALSHRLCQCGQNGGCLQSIS